METERIALSQRDRDRLKVLHEVKQKHLTQAEAAQRLKVTDRQVRRLPLALEEGGWCRGSRATRPSVESQAARLVRAQDSGPCTAALCGLRARAEAGFHKSLRPTASRTYETKSPTPTPKGVQTQIPCAF